MRSRSPFNPSRFADMLDKGLYSTGPKGKELKRERVKLAQGLRKKGKGSHLDLAEKLEQCGPRHRCQSAACPECAKAGQRLVVKVAGRFLNAQAAESTKV